MSLAVLNTSLGALDVLSASLDLRLEGVPLYRIEVDADEAPSGACELLFSTGPRFVGTIARATAFEGRVELVVSGGAGGLSLEPELAVEMTGAGYTGTPIVVEGALVLGDILRATGDELSPDVDMAALTLPRWQRVGDYAGRVLSTLARAWGASWRVRADGRLWLGTETWETYADERNLIEQGLCADTAEISGALVVDRPDIAPGQSVGGRRIERVLYTLSGDALRARLTYQTSERGGALAGALRAAMGEQTSLYSGAHLCRVVQQRADGTLDLIPDTIAIGGATGINRVPLRLGLATARQVIEAGAVVALRFASSSTFPLGDPRLPFAETFADDARATRPIARKGDRVPIASVTYTIGASGGIPPLPLINVVITPTASPYDEAGAPIVASLYGVVLSGIDPGVPYSVEAYIGTGSPEIALRRLDSEDIP